MWVSPFRYPRLSGYLLLPAAFRSLSRLSSALSAKASALCSFLLNLAAVLYSLLLFLASLAPSVALTRPAVQPSFFVLTLLFRFCLYLLLYRPRMSFDIFLLVLQYSVFKVRCLIKTF